MKKNEKVIEDASDKLIVFTKKLVNDEKELKLKYSYDFWYKIYESLPEAYTKTQDSKEQQDICKGCIMHKFCLDTEYMLCGEIMMGMVYINNKNKNNKRG